VSMAPALAIGLCLLATLFLGVFPGRVLDYATLSARQLVNDRVDDRVDDRANDRVPPTVSAGAVATPSQ